MSNIARMMQRATAGAAGAPLDVDDVFSTDTWTGTGGSLTINNGLDLSGEGGLTWIKGRTINEYHNLFDSGVGNGKMLRASVTNAADGPFFNHAFTGTGFSLNSSDSQLNSTSYNYVSWSFRKAPKFFDVVTYTGDGNYNDGNLYSKAIPHNLGVAPHVIIIKRTDSTSDWWIKHKDRTNYLSKLNTTDQEYQDVSPSASRYLPIFRNGNGVSDATHFYLNAGDHTNGLNNPAAVLSNINNATYVAYLFAHNNSDGEFGSSGDQDIIKCGSYTGNGQSTGVTVNLGFEPQFVFLKRTDAGGYYSQIVDSIRGLRSGVSSGKDHILWPNVTAVENTTLNTIDPTATGFKAMDTGNSNVNGSTWIYIAIRRGSLNAPTSSSEVFALDTKNSTGDNKTPLYRSGFPVDLAMLSDTDGGSDFAQLHPRLRTNYYLRSNNSGPEQSGTSFTHDFKNGFMTDSSFNADTTRICAMWKRAPSYFDIVCYSGNGSSQNLNHNLGVVPEMMWVKVRNATVGWSVYHKNMDSSAPEDYAMELDSAGGRFSASGYWNGTAPTSSVFTVGGAAGVNSSYEYVAYLFASLSGVSKVGSYVGNGTSTTVDCGFSNGVKFVIVKQLGSGSWFQFDTTRGINTGNDALHQLNGTGGDYTAADYIDPTSSGFIAVGDLNNMNTNGQTFLFYAIAA